MFFYSLTRRNSLCAITCKGNDILLNSPYIADIKFDISRLFSCKKRAKAKTAAIFGIFWAKTAIFKLKSPIFAENDLL